LDRILLIRHGTTAETRRASFSPGGRSSGGHTPLDAAGVHHAVALGKVLPSGDHCWSSRSASARETARYAGSASGAGSWPEPELLDDLAGCDYGTWTGMDLREVYASDARGLEAWHADPDSAPHGGEGFADVRVRVAAMLAYARSLGGTTIAFTHGSFVRAALLEVLDLPSAAVWRLDVEPGSVTELHPDRGAWRLVRMNWTPRLRGARGPSSHPMTMTTSGRVERVGRPSGPT
jgi:broad specificity phosphatase PhoE